MCRVLYSKQTRGSQFKTTEQRNAFLKKELTSLTNSKGGKENEIKILRAEVEKLTEDVQNKVPPKN